MNPEANNFGRATIKSSGEDWFVGLGPTEPSSAVLPAGDVLTADRRQEIKDAISEGIVMDNLKARFTEVELDTFFDEQFAAQHPDLGALL